METVISLGALALLFGLSGYAWYKAEKYKKEEVAKVQEQAQVKAKRKYVRKTPAKPRAKKSDVGAATAIGVPIGEIGVGITGLNGQGHARHNEQNIAQQQAHGE